VVWTELGHWTDRSTDRRSLSAYIPYGPVAFGEVLRESAVAAFVTHAWHDSHGRPQEWARGVT